MMSLERNAQLEKDLIKLKDELSRLVKWTASSKLLFDMTNQRNNEERDLGYVNKIDPPFNPRSKYIFVSDNLMCLHCGRNGHLKRDCVALKVL